MFSNTFHCPGFGGKGLGCTTFDDFDGLMTFLHILVRGSTPYLLVIVKRANNGKFI
jgi:hypothetical protein